MMNPMSLGNPLLNSALGALGGGGDLKALLKALEEKKKKKKSGSGKGGANAKQIMDGIASIAKALGAGKGGGPKGGGGGGGPSKAGGPQGGGGCGSKGCGSCSQIRPQDASHLSSKGALGGDGVNPVDQVNKSEESANDPNVDQNEAANAPLEEGGDDNRLAADDAGDLGGGDLGGGDIGDGGGDLGGGDIGGGDIGGGDIDLGGGAP